MDYFDNDLIEEIIDANVLATYKHLNAAQYLAPREFYCTGSKSVFERDLIKATNNKGVPPWLTEHKFLAKYRMHRKSFHWLVDRIKDYKMFHMDVAKKQIPVAHQLMVYLFYLGTSGSGANNPCLWNMFFCSHSAVEMYKRQCCSAIRSL